MECSQPLIGDLGSALILGFVAVAIVAALAMQLSTQRAKPVPPPMRSERRGGGW